MNTALINVLRRGLSPFGIFPVRLSKEPDVGKLIQDLRPYECTKPLIRFGSGLDGGYLLPDDLEGIQYCFSPGVSDESSFELECAERDIEVYMADASVSGPAGTHPKFHFIAKFLGATTKGKFISLNDWVTHHMNDMNQDAILQMDIEGFEYETLLATSKEVMNRFRIMVVEFHHLDQLWDVNFFNIAKACFDKILDTHKCVHIHPNNHATPLTMRNLTIPKYMEFTFIRKDRCTSIRKAKTFPHPLDKDCIAGKSIILPECWHD